MPDPMNDGREAAADAARGDNLLKLILAWAWVGIPAAWGIGQVAIKSLALFK